MGSGAKASAAPAAGLKQCQCGAVYTAAEWAALPRRDWRIAGDHLELADCRCGSTISVRLGDDPLSAGAL